MRSSSASDPGLPPAQPQRNPGTGEVGLAGRWLGVEGELLSGLSGLEQRLLELEGHELPGPVVGELRSARQSLAALGEALAECGLLARVELGAWRGEAVAFDPLLDLEEILAGLAPRAWERGVIWRLELGPDLPAEVSADRAAFAAGAERLLRATLPGAGGGDVALILGWQAGDGGSGRLTLAALGGGPPARRSSGDPRRLGAFAAAGLFEHLGGSWSEGPGEGGQPRRALALPAALVSAGEDGAQAPGSGLPVRLWAGPESPLTGMTRQFAALGRETRFLHGESDWKLALAGGDGREGPLVLPASLWDESRFPWLTSAASPGPGVLLVGEPRPALSRGPVRGPETLWLALPTTRRALAAALDHLERLVAEQAAPEAHHPESSRMHAEESSDGDVLDRDVLAALAELDEGEGEPSLLAELIDMFLADTPPRLEALEQAYAIDDAAAIERTAHALKSSCGNLGARRLAELLAELERLARQRALDQVGSLVQRARRDYQDVERALRAELG